MYQSRLNLIVYAKCPYYRTEYRKSITCDGVIEGETVTHSFACDEDKEKFAQEYCMKYPNECPIAKAMDKEFG